MDPPETVLCTISCIALLRAAVHSTEVYLRRDVGCGGRNFSKTLLAGAADRTLLSYC
jgi:hypothetical protein